jgi:transposase
VRLTETCDDNLPRLITNIETTPATKPDDNMIEVVHRSLDSRNLLPSEHLVDKGYTDARVLLASQRDYGVEIIGLVAQDPSWQSEVKTGFDKSAFAIDWEARMVTCPASKQSISWLPKTNPASPRKVLWPFRLTCRHAGEIFATMARAFAFWFVSYLAQSQN